MMTSTSAVSRDPPVSMSRDDDQAKAGSNTTLPVECDTDPGTSPSRKELVKLQLDRDVDELRIAYRAIVICLKPELKLGEKVRGLWQDPPEGWPEDEPFRDPNNDSERGKKPRMAELFAMYKTAVRLYKQKYHEGIPTMDGMPLTVDVSQPQRSVTGSSTCEHLETASGVDAFNKRQHQGTQPEESHMSTLCQPTLLELGIKPLGLGSFTGNEGVMLAAGTLKEGPVPGPGPQLQGAESEVTYLRLYTQVLEELERYDDRESTPANFISDVVCYFTTELKPVVGVGAPMTSYDAGQARCEQPTVSTELRTDVRPNGTLTDSASNADECPQQENVPKKPGNQMQLILCEEPSDPHVQNKSGKRKGKSVVESEPGPPLPKRLCPGTNGNSRRASMSSLVQGRPKRALRPRPQR